jgi:molecular chaperone Hsp33
MHDRDRLRRFVFEGLPVRGQLVHLDASWLALLEHRTYPPLIRDTLGQALAASVLLAATIKFDGLLSLQLRGDGPLSLMLAQCTSGFGVRAVAQHREAVVGTTMAELAGNGHLTVTLESEDREQRYQGIVPLSGARLADCLEVYFAQSEQLPTRLWLQADEHGACGMLLQRLPPAGGVAAAAPESAVDDAWRRVQLIGDTLTPDELRSLSDTEILHRLFHEDDLRVFEPAPVFFRCRCSRERVAGMLRALGEAESRSVIAERGEVEVRCDFCNRAYVFDAVDIEQLFKAEGGAASGAVH